MESSRMASFLIPQCEGASQLTSLLFSHLLASPFGAHTLFFFFFKSVWLSFLLISEAEALWEPNHQSCPNLHPSLG